MIATLLDRFQAKLAATDQRHQTRLLDDWEQVQAVLRAELRAAKADTINAGHHLRHAGAVIAAVVGDERT